jgi:hypothetical protein
MIATVNEKEPVLGTQTPESAIHFQLV